MLVFKYIKRLPFIGIGILLLELYAFITGCKIAFFFTVSYLVCELIYKTYLSFKTIGV